MPPHDTEISGPRGARRASRWVPVASSAALAWAVLVASTPAPFFAWAAPFCVGWLAASALAAPPDLRTRLRLVAADVALGVATALVLYAGSRLFLRAFCGGLSDALCTPLGAMFDRFRTRAVGPGLALFFLIAPAEELFWRGVVQARLAARLGPARAVACATALAALLALATGEPLLALATVPTYAAWGALVAWRGRLVPALVSHAVWSALIAALAPPV